MPKNSSIHSVLVIGSGPIVIGQAAEFDYAGAQACRVLRQEGIRTILVNSNPATIMTDKKLADAIYLEPLTAETLRRIIEKERPDGLLAGLGGQTGLTLAMQLSRDGTLQRFGVKLLGSDIESIERAEDRERFRRTLEEMVRAAASRLTPKNCARSQATVLTFRRLPRCLWRSAFPAGRKSSLRPCATAPAMSLRYVPWKTWTLSASIPATRSSWPRR